ncbi:conserved hypothetical protein [Sulfurimonas autotrophica DSM 16294]|uniref:Uncharacterized protein n=1 Tax=Sulfurimonas autotrophica (strain ATCC BAA-671 / DSM 16294 / JCM 11897 / OK10) TaxID=563040 RepID=E0USA7_SULAO|nr:hypothetical protein [Sulfurimonas autotrophica]ADN10200.1 conserved hypothetical protein [Sulfurimonas autotrophica DSM 16294]
MPIDLERFDNFKDAELRIVNIVSPTHIKLTVAVQDRARAFDWITLELDFTGVTDARLLEQNKLKFIDMNEGASLLHVNNEFAFGIGACYNASTIKNSTLYIISKDLKYKEEQF